MLEKSLISLGPLGANPKRLGKSLRLAQERTLLRELCEYGADQVHGVLGKSRSAVVWRAQPQPRPVRTRLDPLVVLPKGYIAPWRSRRSGSTSIALLNDALAEVAAAQRMRSRDVLFSLGIYAASNLVRSPARQGA